MDHKPRLPLPKRTSYWKAYGGIRSVIKSPFIYLSLVVLAVCFPFWSADGWWAVVIGGLPTILGFTIAAFTLTLGLSGSSFKRMLHRESTVSGTSLYLKVSAIFVHQIICQSAALMLAIVFSAVWLWPAPIISPWTCINKWAGLIGWAIGFFLFIYSLFLVVAGAFNIFSLSRMIQLAATHDERITQIDN